MAGYRCINYSRFLKTLTPLFKEAGLKNYKPQLIENDLIDEEKIPKNLSDEDWISEVLNQIRGPTKFENFVSIFKCKESDGWIVERIEEALKRFSDEGTDCFNIKPPHKGYVERKGLEQKCLQVLKEKKSVNLTGMPGSGKSMVARKISFLLEEFLKDEKSMVSDQEQDMPVNKIWLDCSSEQVLNRSLFNIPSLSHKTADVRGSMKNFLLKLPSEAVNIIIFYHIDRGIWNSIEEWLHEAPEYYCIFTTTDSYIRGPSVQVGGLTKDEIGSLSEIILANKLTANDIDMFHKNLDNVLGLTVAFSSMKESGSSATRYLKVIEVKRKIPCLGYGIEFLRGYRDTLDRVLENSITEIKEDFSQKKVPHAERILNVIAFLGSSNIPVDTIAQVLLDEKDTDEAVITLVAALRSRSIADAYDLPNGSKEVNLKSGVRDALFRCIDPNLECNVLDDAFSFLCHFCSKDTRFATDYDIQVTFMPHVESFVKNQNVSSIQKVWLLLNVGHLCTQQKRPDAAQKHLDGVLEEVSDIFLDDIVELCSLNPSILEDQQFQRLCEVIKEKTEAIQTDVEKIICNQRVSVETIKMWKQISGNNKRKSYDGEKEFLMTPREYNRCFRKNLALSLDRVKQYFLLEFIASMLYTSGRVCFYKGKAMSDEDREMSELSLQLAKKLCKHVERNYEFLETDGLLHTELVARNGLLYHLLGEMTSDQDDAFEKAKKAKEEYEEMLNNPVRRFEFGLLKMTGSEPYRMLTCKRQMIKAYTIMLSSKKVENLSEEARRKLENEALRCVDEQDDLIEVYEKNNHDVHSKASYWNAAGRLFIALHSLKKAEDYFIKACRAEQGSSTLNYPWWDAILGLVKLFKQRATQYEVLYENLKKYSEHVKNIKEMFPGNDYKDEDEKVENLLRDLAKDPLFSNDVVRQLHRTFSTNEEDDEADDDEANGFSQDTGQLPRTIQENTGLESNGDDGLSGTATESDETNDNNDHVFGNMINPVQAQQHEQPRET